MIQASLPEGSSLQRPMKWPLIWKAYWIPCRRSATMPPMWDRAILRFITMYFRGDRISVMRKSTWNCYEFEPEAFAATLASSPGRILIRSPGHASGSRNLNRASPMMLLSRYFLPGKTWRCSGKYPQMWRGLSGSSRVPSMWKTNL
jgi:hypothetical protein